MADGKVIYEVRADDSNLNNDLDNSNKKVEKSTSKLTENAAKTSKVIGTSFLAIGAAAVGVSVAAVKSANDMDVAMNGFIASTGVAATETERYQGVLENIYANNYGESFEDIATAMTSIRQQLGPIVDGWSDEGIQKFTESAFALRDTFGYEIPESTRAANTMMTQFGIDGSDALSMIAKGAQNGLDFSGELLDSINEYSVQFAKVGLDADDMFNIFQTGADSGAFNLDKIGDAVKEFAIRAIDGSKTTAGGFEAIGLNADEMAAKMAAGGKSAKSAYTDTIKALANMTDPLQQNAAAVALFGTQAEDLGTEAIKALAGVSDAAYDSADAMTAIKDVKYDDMGSMLSGLGRSLELLLIPLGEKLIPVLSEAITAIMPFVEEILPVIIENLGWLFDAIIPIIEEALPVFMELFKEIAGALAPIIQELLPVLLDLFKELAPPLMEIVDMLLPIFVDLINMLLPLFLTLTEALLPLIDLFIVILGPILDLINLAIMPLINILVILLDFILGQLIDGLMIMTEIFRTVFAGISDYVSGQVDRIKNILSSIIDFVRNVFTGNWADAWQNIKDIFGNIFSGIVEMAKFPLNAIVDLTNGFVDGINKVQVPDWVPGVGGKGINIPKIPRLKVGMDYVPSDYFPAFLDKGERVLTAEENALYSSRGIQNLAGPVNSTTQSLNFDSMGISKSDIKDAFKEAIKEIPAQDTVIQLGYEEVARAANKGNVILETRYGK